MSPFIIIICLTEKGVPLMNNFFSAVKTFYEVTGMKEAFGCQRGKELFSVLQSYTDILSEVRSKSKEHSPSERSGIYSLPENEKTQKLKKTEDNQ